MKIYTVKTLEDLGHVYNGIDGIGIYTFATLKEAQDKMAEIVEDEKERFLTTGCDEEDLEIRIDEKSFDVTDGEDVVYGEIIEQELNLDIYAITTVSVDPYEPASVSTYFRHSKEDADLEYDEIKNNLYNDKLEEFDAEEDEEVSSQDKLDEFISNHVQHDYEFTNGNRYFHLVEESGDELVILTEKLDFKEEE